MSENKKSSPESPAPAAGTTVPAEDVLGGEVIGDAERQAERIRRRGQRDAEQIHESAEKEAKEAAEAVLASAHRRAEQVSAMVLATVGVEEQKVTLTLKDETVQRVLDAAWQKVLAKDGYDYRAALVGLALSAISQMPGAEFTLELGEDDRERVKEDVCRSIERALAAQRGRAVTVHLSPTYLTSAGGCVVKAENGRLRYDSSFEARRRRLHEEVRRWVAQELFGSSEGGGASPNAHD